MEELEWSGWISPAKSSEARKKPNAPPALCLSLYPSLPLSLSFASLANVSRLELIKYALVHSSFAKSRSKLIGRTFPPVILQLAAFHRHAAMTGKMTVLAWKLGGNTARAGNQLVMSGLCCISSIPSDLLDSCLLGVPCLGELLCFLNIIVDLFIFVAILGIMEQCFHFDFSFSTCDVKLTVKNEGRDKKDWELRKSGVLYEENRMK